MRENFQQLMRRREAIVYARRHLVLSAARRETGSSNLELLNQLAPFHGARNDYEAKQFALKSPELEAILTLKVCEIYWQNPARTWLKDFESMLIDLPLELILNQNQEPQNA
ncbi:TPA: hypothetical protein NIG83_005216 [Pseudomonas aeruginosa]|uniref:Uncharacterized protein n=2 Tax=Pseudomonas TaxID=286 RepID=A0A1H2LKF5_9PSED|nr:MULTISPECIES: hypothetical protein [Pseudomonas]EQM69658.1 hypothetical protein L682_01655 [Pseudomonas alcaligenes OT 69]MDN4147372.1 hypothetical protein [Pseudomonas tohonis]EKU8043598.1 hypothetical protein [Pseudomonas aeruginosa]EKX2797450.1 hypothetical protein [Pseudomonas aeruginosa]ERZ44038.1 hypothetical protein Q001_01482 [Pseudomonas aeruginosa CF127]